MFCNLSYLPGYRARFGFVLFRRKRTNCGDISDYVNEVDSSNYDQICPVDNSIGGCQPPAGGCPSGEIWVGEPICSCIGISAVCVHQCDPATYQNTTVQTNTECSNVEPGPEYGTSQKIIADVLKNNRKSATRSRGSVNPNDPQAVTPGCGLITYTKTCEYNESAGKYCEKEATHCYAKDCKALFGEGYHLAGPNYPGHNKCDCVKDCDQNVPHGVADICGTSGSCNSIQICDPCSSSSQQGQQGGNDRGGDLLLNSCCGWQKTDHNTVECNFSTGEWECVNHEDPCNEVPSDAGKPCDGTSITPVDPHIVEGNQCGIVKINQCKINDSCSGADAITSCELKGSSACFEGQISTEGCENGEQKVCGSDCQWSDCAPAGDCDCSDIPKPTEIVFVPNTANCKKYDDYKCERNEETNQCEWQPDEDTINWSQPNYNCITGMPPILCPDSGSAKGGSKGGNLGGKLVGLGGAKGGAKGGRGLVDPGQNCAWAGQCECLRGCNDYPSEPEQEYCVSVLCGGPCDFCDGYSGGLGYGGQNFCEAQNCYPGYFWNYITCSCQIIPNNGGGGGSEPLTYAYQYCHDCVLTDCTFCNPEEKPSDLQTSCALYKTACWEEAHTWVAGEDYYNSYMSGGINAGDSNIYWFDGYDGTNCEAGQTRYCDGYEGRKTCQNCHWSDCNHNSHTETVTGIVNSNGNVYLCSGSIGSQNIVNGVDVCYSGSDTYDECSPNDTAVCNGTTTALASCSNNHYQYCQTHGSGAKCLISASTCNKADCVEKLCPNAPPQYWPDHNYEENRNCSGSITILVCD